MKTFLPRSLVCALLLLGLAGAASAAPDAKAAPGKPDSATTAALKKVTERYALTRARIATLVDRRMAPVPLPASLPNPFYRPLELPPTDATPATTPDVVPAAPDSSDADTLAKFASTLKVSGVINLNGQPHLTINSLLCKTGDVIPAGSKDHPLYIQVLRITPDEITLGLNKDQQTVRLRR